MQTCVLTTTDKQRIKVVEQFLVSQLKDIQTDKLIVEAVKLIYQSNGTIRIKELKEKLFISQSPFEKRFRKVVGTTAKKFSSIVRFNSVLDNLSNTKTLTEICYENNFFDQAHFIKDFKHFTSDTPEKFQMLLVEKRFFTYKPLPLPYKATGIFHGSLWNIDACFIVVLYFFTDRTGIPFIIFLTLVFIAFENVGCI